MRPSRRDLLHALPLSLLHASSPPAPALRQLWLRAPFDNLFLPRTRWPWPAPPPSPRTITSQLEALHSIGIGGVEIAPSSPGFLEATRRAVDPVIRDILLAFGPMLGRTVDSLYIPPPPNTILWSPGTLAEFRRRRGYDLTPLLPALFFDIGPRTAAIRADVKAFVSALIEEYYYQPIREACRRILVHPRTDSPTLDGNALEAMQRNADALFHDGVTRFYHPQPPTLAHYRSLAAYIARASALLRQGSPAAAPSLDGLQVSRRILGDGVEIFFVSNPGSTRTVFSYSVEGKWFEVWDPATGSITSPTHPAEIQPAQSLFVVFHPGRRKPRRFFFGFPSRFFRRRASME